MEDTKEKDLFINNIDNEVTILYNEFRSQLDAKFSYLEYGLAIEAFMQLLISENVIHSMMFLKDYTHKNVLKVFKNKLMRLFNKE
jgi:hypothetical protein